ncbi:uncharacterized protein LOC21408494 isoform X4 [Morus notabilis]|uniref:uncharacterized protein LOC21408494 isoform X4 n=1 Tax=Morus notabilis TaxID=981085 RepID=UPI000CED7F73|nr:uncharacterized protein LOC21408494 isoform X4 [Morus notabilis]
MTQTTCDLKETTLLYQLSIFLSPIGHSQFQDLSVMASSKKWASTISSFASCTYFLVIILQIPLFRAPCRAGICRTPLELTSSQLIATKLIPEVAVKTLLYPGAIANAFFNYKTMPNYYNFLKSYQFATLHSAPMMTFDDLKQLELVFQPLDNGLNKFRSLKVFVVGWVIPDKRVVHIEGPHRFICYQRLKNRLHDASQNNRCLLEVICRWPEHLCVS